MKSAFLHAGKYQIRTLICVITIFALILTWYNQVRLSGEIGRMLKQIKSQKEIDLDNKKELINRRIADKAISGMDLKNKLHLRAIDVIRKVEHLTRWHKVKELNENVQEIYLSSMEFVDLLIFHKPSTSLQDCIETAVVLMDREGNVVDVDIKDGLSHVNLILDNGVPRILFTYQPGANESKRSKSISISEDGFNKLSKY